MKIKSGFIPMKKHSDMIYFIIALRFQPIRCRHGRLLFFKTHLLKMNNNLPLKFTPAFLYLGCFYDNFVQTCHIQSKLLLRYTNISFDVALPSEFSQHSELNGGLIVRKGSLHRTRGNLCASQTYQS